MNADDDAICSCGDHIGPRTGALCGTCASMLERECEGLRRQLATFTAVVEAAQDWYCSHCGLIMASDALEDGQPCECCNALHSATQAALALLRGRRVCYGCRHLHSQPDAAGGGTYHCVADPPGVVLGEWGAWTDDRDEPREREPGCWRAATVGGTRGCAVPIA